MIDFIIKYWVQFGFGLLVGGLGYLWKKVKAQRTEYDALRGGMQALLRNAIVESYNKWSEKGYCPIYARENVNRMYKPYHALGGNDIATDLVHDLNELPTQPQEVKHNRRSTDKHE